MRILLAIVALSLITSTAFGQRRRRRRLSPQETRARELFQLGDRMYASGRYDLAISAFEEAYDLSPRPLLLFNLANAQERAGYLAAAVESLERYAPNAPREELPTLRGRIEALRARVAAEREREEQLQALRDQANSSQAVATTTPVPVEPAEEGPDLLLPIVVLSAGGVLAAVGGVFAGLALDARGTAQSDCTETDGARYCLETADSALARDSTFSLTADILFGAALATIGVGTYFLIDALLSSDTEESDTQVGIVVAPTGLGLTARHSF